MQPEDAALRRVDDRRAHHGAIDAAIGDRERAPLELVQLELVVGGAAGEIIDRQFDAGKRHGLGVAEHRHDKPLAAPDGDPDVTVVAVDDVRLPILGVYLRHSLESLHGGTHEERHEAEFHAMPLLEHVLELRPQRHHSRHVDLVEGRQQGRLLLGFDKPLSDPLPDWTDEDIAFLTAATCRQSASGLGRHDRSRTGSSRHRGRLGHGRHGI